ncbi:hypothetical protein MAMP_00063 [Methylophaga aminisulfidivorans MP]|uniref:Uncharacterized protein n=1 Tax=Methylophaga aminisulfidivorans MP TaxID=1026882 RepID=F5SXW3_9GAMM|nr:hypothetical protein MAMP_00063 [Methylophaga aminisulfidivorans MP]
MLMQRKETGLNREQFGYTQRFPSIYKNTELSNHVGKPHTA